MFFVGAFTVLFPVMITILACKFFDRRDRTTPEPQVRVAISEEENEFAEWDAQFNQDLSERGLTMGYNGKAYPRSNCMCGKCGSKAYCQ
jgi:hypothetical protein